MEKDDTKTPPAKDWPNTVKTRTDLDAALEAGEKSGVSKRSFENVIKEARSSLDNA